MKFALPIKFFQAGCVAAAIGFGTMRAEAQTNTFAFPAIGTYSNVLAYAVSQVSRTFIFIWAYDTNGAQVAFGSIVVYGSTDPYTSKFQIDQEVIAPQLTNALIHLETNSNPNIDKDKGLVIYVGCAGILGGNPSLDFFYAPYISIKLVKDGNKYSIPDLSWFSTEVNSIVPVYISNLQWTRIEVGYRGDTVPFEVDDELYDPTTDPIDYEGDLDLPTSYVTNSSSASGDFWVKTIIFNGKYFVFNGDGNQIPETPMVLALNQNGTNATVTVNGGDSGRGFVLQSSPDLSAWTNCSPVTFISPTNDLPGALPSQFVYPANNRLLFFRLATTNLPPS
jgi:hypothetical protein